MSGYGTWRLSLLHAALLCRTSTPTRAARPTPRALGSLFARFGQPSVIGEITAGILLGPSLFGWLWPEASAFVFAPDTLGVLALFSQIGVCLLMFAVGLELDVGHLRQKAQTALVVSHTSIVVPFLLGVASALLLFPWFGIPGSSFIAFALFMGI